ncbi:NCS2 family permease [Olsenella sp. AF16-14LB]|uniref:NCS2 family permease n=1 Tax=Atopobiaceae TaxID=1643824 RepID=UPI0005099A00|nr:MULTISPECIES: NCS2 family permease [unclassified Olsenella]RGJ47344.1 NCS2 family permease [Olsenella sp. TM06-36]RGS53029.1 NCS2 family permease [Olsenella sp. AF21-51]RGU51639.1 NCS2 family permease [Olsenella sp. AF16-14LB]RGU82868.1 NCS2 family permease [Olsenella sp. AF15-43LB]RHB56869.1 NCS2 family permease [Olsenella sp. AM39-30AC]
MEKFFKMGERGSSTGQEVRAGLTTFLAMAYIIAVNPSLLAAAGVPMNAAVTSTCVGAGIMTIFMGLFANRPLACASGMGINAVVAYTLAALNGADWQVSMAVIFVEGCAILILVLCGLREAIMDAIPVSLRHAISVGLGLFIAMIGLADGGIIVANESTMVSFGDVTSPTFLVGLISIVATVILYSMNIKGSILIGIIIAVLCGIPLGVTQMPSGIVSALDFSSFGAPFMADSTGTVAVVKVLTTPILLVFAFSLMMSDFFDTMGTAMAVAKQGEFLNEDGTVENIREILIADSAAAAVGGLLGASSITTFVESASGAADGGRTGLTSVFTGILFILAAFFAPVISVVSSAATCGALVIVGFLMMTDVVDIDWTDLLEGFPAFMVIAGIPLTYSISNGIGMGFIAYVIVALVTGRGKKIKPLMWVATAAFVVYFLLS